MSEFAITCAISPPIVPAPTTAALKTNMSLFSGRVEVERVSPARRVSLVVAHVSAVAPRVVTGGCLARTQEAAGRLGGGPAGEAGCRAGRHRGSSAARASEDHARRRQGPLECDRICVGDH